MAIDNIDSLKFQITLIFEKNGTSFEKELFLRKKIRLNSFRQIDNKGNTKINDFTIFLTLPPEMLYIILNYYLIEKKKLITSRYFLGKTQIDELFDIMMLLISKRKNLENESVFFRRKRIWSVFELRERTNKLWNKEKLTFFAGEIRILENHIRIFGDYQGILKKRLNELENLRTFHIMDDSLEKDSINSWIEEQSKILLREQRESTNIFISNFLFIVKK